MSEYFTKTKFNNLKIMEKSNLDVTIQLALGGSQKAYKDIYCFLAPFVKKAIRNRIFGIRDDALNDILQDIMIKIFVRLDSFALGRNFKVWAIFISNHHCIDLSRRRVLAVTYEENLEYYENKICVNEPINDFFIDKKQLDIYCFAKEHLSRKCNLIVREKYLFGLKQKQIANKHNIPMGSIAGLQAHSIAEFRKKVVELDLDLDDFV